MFNPSKSFIKKIIYYHNQDWLRDNLIVDIIIFKNKKIFDEDQAPVSTKIYKIYQTNDTFTYTTYIFDIYNILKTRSLIKQLFNQKRSQHMIPYISIIVIIIHILLIVIISK